MPRLVADLGPEKNCMRIFKKTQTKGLSKLLLSKKKCSISSVNLKSQLRQANSYLQVSKARHCVVRAHRVVSSVRSSCGCAQLVVR